MKQIEAACDLFHMIMLFVMRNFRRWEVLDAFSSIINASLFLFFEVSSDLESTICREWKQSLFCFC